MLARIDIDPERTIGAIDPRLFGGFLEHMGRAVYEGIYDPASPLADERGFRRDVLAALRELNPPVIRYPGGNFLSGYHWQDGVGPRERRPRRRDLAWRSIETNQFGTDEFIDYCRLLDTAPMLGVNLGTGTLDEAGALVEYCNAPTGTRYADLRAANGHVAPHDVRIWCLGNEMDGPWQIGHLEAEPYALKAREAAKVMRLHDPAIELVLAGSSSTNMPTYPDWDRTALEICWEQVNYLSLHYYAENRANDAPSFLALSRQFESHIDTLAGILRYVKAKQRSRHDVYLSWDEWNVWYKDMTMDGRWSEAPHLIEEVYNVEDMLVAAQWLNVFLRRCDVLKIACIAQLVNIIAPILTRRDGLLKQTIFYPLQLFRQHARGAALDLLVRAPESETKQFGPVPVLDASAAYDAPSGACTVFVVNRSLQNAVPVELRWQRGAPSVLESVTQVSGSDPKAANTWEQPGLIRPVALAPVRVVDSAATLSLPPLSFTVLSGRAVA